jgi:hypothetical protein
MDRQHNIYMASHWGIFLFLPDQNSYRIVWENPDVNNFVKSVTVISPDSIFFNRIDGQPVQLIKQK